MRRIPRSQTRFRVATPRVNPGSEPVQPPRLAGVWTVADTQTQHIPNHQKRVASSYSFTTHTHQHVTTTPSTRHSDSHIKLGLTRRTVGQPPLVLFIHQFTTLRDNLEVRQSVSYFRSRPALRPQAQAQAQAHGLRAGWAALRPSPPHLPVL